VLFFAQQADANWQRGMQCRKELTMRKKPVTSRPAYVLTSFTRLIVLLALTACGSTISPIATFAPAPTRTLPTPTPTPNSVQPCRASDLVAEWDGHAGLGATRYAVGITIANTSFTPCTLTGFATIELRDKMDAPIPLTITQCAPPPQGNYIYWYCPPVTTATLMPTTGLPPLGTPPAANTSAEIGLFFTYTDDPGGAPCHVRDAADATHGVLVLPDTGGVLSISGPIERRATEACGMIRMGTFVAPEILLSH